MGVLTHVALPTALGLAAYNMDRPGAMPESNVHQYDRLRLASGIGAGTAGTLLGNSIAKELGSTDWKTRLAASLLAGAGGTYVGSEVIAPALFKNKLEHDRADQLRPARIDPRTHARVSYPDKSWGDKEQLRSLQTIGSLHGLGLV